MVLQFLDCFAATFSVPFSVSLASVLDRYSSFLDFCSKSMFNMISYVHNLRSLKRHEYTCHFITDW